jgi:hypothetical protein
MKVKMMKLRAMRKDGGGMKTKMSEMKMRMIPAGMHMMPDGSLMKNSAHRADSDMMRRR